MSELTAVMVRSESTAPIAMRAGSWPKCLVIGLAMSSGSDAACTKARCRSPSSKERTHTVDIGVEPGGAFELAARDVHVDRSIAQRGQSPGGSLLVRLGSDEVDRRAGRRRSRPSTRGGRATLG